MKRWSKICSIGIFCCLYGSLAIGQTTLDRCEYRVDGKAWVNTLLGKDGVIVVPMDSVAIGLHELEVRVRQSDGYYSLSHSRSFMKFDSIGEPKHSGLRYEYYIDTDPGLGKALNATVSSDGVMAVDLKDIPDGVHQICVRTEDESGRWSLLHVGSFIRVSGGTGTSQYEYYMDTDPGFGKGLPFSPDANGAATIAMDTVPAGVHQWFVRMKDGNGIWSLTHSGVFVKFDGKGADSPIARMEYFWDTDPGFGNGTEIKNFGSDISATVPGEFSPNIFGLSFGQHVLHVRAKDKLGTWSLIGSGNVEIVRKGVTVIVHGFSLTGAFPDWTKTMAAAIKSKAGGGNIFKNNPKTSQWEPVDNSNTNNPDDEIILIYDWGSLSNNGLISTGYAGNGYLESAADNLFAMLTVPNLPGLGNTNLLEVGKPLHFIGHSRGNPLSLQVFHRMLKYFPGKRIDQYTLLDPHPATTFGDVQSEDPKSPPSLPGILGYATNCHFLRGCNNANTVMIKLPENVVNADNYFRRDGEYEGLDPSFDGVPVFNNRNVNHELSDKILKNLACLEGGTHSNIHAWYSGTISMSGIGYPKCSGDGTSPINDNEPADWYKSIVYVDQSFFGNRMHTGFNMSRLGGLGYPVEYSSKASLQEMEAALAKRTGDGLKPVFNGNFMYGDGAPGWSGNGGYYYSISGHQARLEGGLRHSYFYFAPQVLADRTADYRYLKFKVRTYSKSRTIRVTFSTPEGVVQVIEKPLSLPKRDTWYSISVPIPDAIQGKIGTFEIKSDDITVFPLYLDGFELTQ